MDRNFTPRLKRSRATHIRNNIFFWHRYIFSFDGEWRSTDVLRCRFSRIFRKRCPKSKLLITPGLIMYKWLITYKWLTFLGCWDWILKLCSAFSKIIRKHFDFLSGSTFNGITETNVVSFTSDSRTTSLFCGWRWLVQGNQRSINQGIESEIRGQ